MAETSPFLSRDTRSLDTDAAILRQAIAELTRRRAGITGILSRIDTGSMKASNALASHFRQSAELLDAEIKVLTDKLFVVEGEIALRREREDQA